MYKRQDLDQPVVFMSSVYDATGMIPAKLAVERKTHIPWNLMFGSLETEFEGQENYLSQDVYKRQIEHCSVI